MTAFARFLVPLLAALALASSASADSPKPNVGLVAPQDLHAFLLRADEARADTFPRTPSFAWTPTRGAVRYEFQVSTSNVFRESGIIFEDANVKGATLAVPVALPWITGNPHALFARVRAVLPSGAVTPWSSSVGFNVRWPTIPAPLTSYPGLLRWTPVDGATGYEVWLIEAGKTFSTPTNVADQREYYIFHQDTVWTGSVHWRVRAQRVLYGARANGLPAVSYGPWSPTYTSVNPAFVTGKLAVTAAVSDIVSDTSSAADAHRLMPGFAFTGNQTLDGEVFELYRVYVFTDSDCVNVVYRGAIVGGPAYAPRSTGPLDLPDNAEELTDARDTYLDDGEEGVTKTADGHLVQTTESDKRPEAESKEGEDQPADGSGSGSAEGEGEEDDSTAGAKPSEGGSALGGTAGAGTSLQEADTVEGAPVDLWDTDWPTGGYYWTVVPVEPIIEKPAKTSVGTGAAAGASSLVLTKVDGFEAEDTIRIGTDPTADDVAITAVDTDTRTVTLAAPLSFAHGAGELVLETSGEYEYVDVEVPQDACEAGRVHRFGKGSEPTVSSSTTPFASGLSPVGRLISAASEKNPVFHGSPLVAWTPALGADGYEVQWSKQSYPFKAEGTYVTFGTSAALPLKPGTWYYRVRGLNLDLVGPAQRMSWTDPVKITVGKPTFTVLGKASTSGAVSKGTTKTTQLSTVNLEDEGFSVGVPKGWETVDQSADSPLLLEAVAPVAEQGFFSNMNVVAGDPRGSKSMTQWANALKAEISGLEIVGGSLASKIVKLKAGNAVKLTYKLKTADERQVSITQFVIDTKEASFVLTFTTAPTLVTKYASLFTLSANSFALDS